MAKIPYRFIPMPEEFLTDDFIDDGDMMRLIRWIMKRVSPAPSSIPLKKQKRNLELSPYEFMFGRNSCSLDTGISTKKIQVRINQLIGLGFLKKVVSKSVSTFTVYTLSTSAFAQNGGQHNGQQHGQHVGQQVDHNQEGESDISLEKNHPPLPPSDADLIDDSFQEIPLIEVYQGVFLSQSELDECVAIKGSVDAVKHAVEFIMRSPGRKKKIQNWPNAMATWTIKSTIKPRAAENEAHAKRLESLHGNNPGWRCQVWRDKIKDVRGILFYNTSSQGMANTVFVSFVDPEYKEKTFKLLRDKRMLKALIPNP